MYFYCHSYGEYEQYMEHVFYHEKQFSETEFKDMLVECDVDYHKLCKKFGFKEVSFDVHLHE